MPTKSVLGIVGSVLLFLGVFLPVISVPIVGGINYFRNGKPEGVIIVLLAIASLLITLRKSYRALWVTGVASLGILASTLIRLEVRMSQAKSKMESDLAGNPFKGIADVAMQSVQMQWGWAVLVIGSVLLIAAAAMKEKAANVA